MYAISWIDVRDRAAVEASVQTFDMLWAVGCFGGAADELARSLHDADTFIVGAQRIRSMILWPPGACGGYAEVADALVGGQPLGMRLEAVEGDGPAGGAGQGEGEVEVEVEVERARVRGKHAVDAGRAAAVYDVVYYTNYWDLKWLTSPVD